MTWNWLRRTPTRRRHTRISFRFASFVDLENRITPVAPNPPVITEPFAEGQITGTFDVNIQTDPAQYFDADGHTWQATDWLIRDVSSGQTVWQLPFTSSPPLTLYRVDFSDGTFVGSLAGRTELNYNTNYQVQVRYRDSAGEVSAASVRGFRTTSASQPVPGAGTWLVRPGYVVEPVQTGLRLPVNVAFVPNAGPNPSDPLYYVAELYGSIRVVRRDGTMSTFATGLLDYNPDGPISGTGEQGMTGLAVERDSVNPAIYHLYVGMLWNNGAPPGGPNHYPKVERIDSTAGGLTMGSRTLLLNMQPETQGQSHIISNVSIGPDNKLYVHMGDGFDASTALNLDMYRGKVLRMNKDGSPVATGDPAGANPFYNAANGINARDYVYTYGHRNPFGGAWRPSDGKQWIVENGNSLDRMVDLTAGQSYGWAGNDSTHIQFSKFIWNPATAPVNIDFVDSTRFGGSGFPAEAYGHAYVSLSGSTYASGPQQRSKGIVEFPDLNTLGGDGKLLVQPSFLVKYNGTGRATVAGLAAGPDGLYFTDLYEDTGSGGATGSGANLYRVRYVGTSGGEVPTVATAAVANPSPVVTGITTNLSVLGADDGGEANLTYTWGLQGTPPAPVSFSANGNNAAKNTVATFAANGTYNFFVVIRDLGGQTAISSVSVNVTSVPVGTGNGIRGVYYNNIDFTGTSVTRIDPSVNFDWGTGSPDPAIGANTFSARWTGYVQPRYTETYTFITTTDDGVRLYVNNQLIVDHFVDQGATEWTGTIALQAGQTYAIRMDYYENGGDASAKLEWQSPAQPRQVIPQTQLYAPTAAPAAPANLAAVPFGGTRIDLNWANAAVAPNFADGFLVEQSLTGTGGWSQVANAATMATSVTGLTPGTTYYYRVRAFNAIGNSAYSAVVAATTSTQGNAIDYPVNFAGVPGGGALTFVGGAAIVNNNLRLTSGVGNQARATYATNQQTITAFTTTFTYTKTGAADGATFVVQRDPRGLAAIGAAGNQLAYTGITPSLAFAMNIYQPNGYGTTFVTNGATPGGYTQTNVDFGADNSPITVTITYLGGTTITAVMTQGANTETKTFSLPSSLATLLGGSTAFVGFTGSTGGANSTQDITNWTFATLTVPSAPTNVQSTLTGYTGTSTTTTPIVAHLTWGSTAGAVSYKIERKLTAGGTYAQIGTSALPVFDDSGLAPNSTYFYRIRGTNPVGDGAFSTEWQVTTPGALAAPTNAQTTAVTTTSVTFSWTDNASNEDGYQIFRSVSGGTFALLTSRPPNTTSFTDSGLTPGTRYDYHAVAYNLSGPSNPAVVVTETRTLAPTGLAAAPVSGAINLTWAVTDGADTYSVYRATTPGGQGATPLVSGLTSLSYSDTALAYGTTYYYVVTATNLGGESARSNEAFALVSGATATNLLTSVNPSPLGTNVTFTAMVSSAGGIPTTGTVQFFDGATPLGSPVPLAAGGVATLTTNTLSAATHVITATYSGSTGFAASTSNAINQVVMRAPQVASVAVNDGQGQRSLLRSVTLTFDALVSFPAGDPASAFQLTGPGAAGVTLMVDTSGSTATQTVARITFAGGSVVNGSLADGRYVLRVLANQVHDAAGNTLDGNGSGTGGTDFVYGDDTATERLFRLFGDHTGDGTVNAADYGSFRNAFGSSTGQAAYIEWLDIDGDGFINAFDFAQFRTRFGTSLP